MRTTWAITAAALVAFAPGVGGAQVPVRQTGAPTTAVTGIAFDSLGRVPLVGAFVTLAGAGQATRSTTSDENGLFRFDSVAPGTYTVAMQHAVFDSIGISGASERVTIRDGRDTLHLSTPSFARIWSVACGAAPVPGSRDSGVVFGTLRSAETRRPVANATVTVRWVEIGFDKNAGVTQHGWEAEVRSDSSGDYGACDVPASSILRVGAATDSAHGDVASGIVDVVPNGRRVARLDLLLADRMRDSSSRVSGFVTGIVTSEVGQPVADALVRVEGAPNTRTDSAGDFLLRDVPLGTRELSVQSVGAAEVAAMVDVVPNDTARVMLQLRKVATLSAVQVKAAAAQRYFVNRYMERKSHGLGYFADSTTIGKLGTTSSIFESIPGVRVNHNLKHLQPVQIILPLGAVGCRANLWIDGHPADSEQLGELSTSDIAAVETYVRQTDTPLEFTSPMNSCGSVLVWSKRAFP